MASVTDLINKLTDIKNEEVVKVVLPSTMTTVAFTPINVKQQKSLLRLTMDGPSGVASMLHEMNNIIKDNVIDKTVTISSIDKYPILLALRRNSLGDLITINDKQYNLSDLPTPSKLPKALNGKTVDQFNIKVDIELPSLDRENEYLSKAIAEIKRSKEDQGKETITTMYIFEIIKFITKINFEGGEIKFDEIGTHDKKTIVESLPVSLNQKILNEITKVRDYENNFITFSDNTIVPINTLFLTKE